MTEETLLPCPFCGSANVGFWDTGLPDTMAGCNDCHANSGWDENREEAIAAWNTRTTTDLQARLDAAEAKNAELVEVLNGLEWACEELAATRTQEVYLAMIDSGQSDGLLVLDNRRRAARAALARTQGETP